MYCACLCDFRELLTQDLHNTVRVSDSAPFGKLPILVGGHDSSRKEKKTAENVAQGNNNGISASTFRLPTCQIRYRFMNFCSCVFQILLKLSSTLLPVLCFTRSLILNSIN